MININQIKIGMRLHFKGNSIIPPLSGTITKIYPAFPEIQDDKDAVALEIDDELPENWPYPDPIFAPWLEDCELEKTDEPPATKREAHPLGR